MSVTTAALLTALSAQWSAVAAVWINHRTVGPIVHGDLTAAAQRAAEPAGHGLADEPVVAGQAARP